MILALLIKGPVQRDELDDLWNVDGRTQLGKLVKAMRNHDTLFRSGTTSNDVASLINTAYGRKVRTDIDIGTGRKLLRFIIERLKKNYPAIVGIKNKDMAHWLLATCFDIVDNMVTKLFFLDPSGESTSSYWNATIDIENKEKFRYPYAWVDCESNKNIFVQFEEAICIGNYD